VFEILMHCRRVISLLIGLAFTAALFSQEQPTWRPEKLDAPSLPNAYRLHARVISGGEPAGEEAFATLKNLGVQTIISVDGARPQLELAKKYGLRYVHLPHGYDGVPDHRAKELAKAVRDLPGPIYIHCHHGKHRSPAAATVACVAAGLLAPEQALSVLTTAGTSENYRGLYQSAQSARQLDAKLLDELRAEFPETVKVPPIADAMVQIEHTYDHLKQFTAADWQPLEKQPDLDPAHEALLLKEHYYELARTPDVQKQPSAFRQLLTESEQTAAALETLLTNWQKSGRQVPTPAKITSTFAATTQNCASCHQKFRDVPLTEKQSRADEPRRPQRAPSH
jgi:protein tyrosine phosphatase (PTP) superfamily phosphohydrolase (DUF442 family)